MKDFKAMCTECYDLFWASDMYFYDAFDDEGGISLCGDCHALDKSKSEEEDHLLGGCLSCLEDEGGNDWRWRLRRAKFKTDWMRRRERLHARKS